MTRRERLRPKVKATVAARRGSAVAAAVVLAAASLLTGAGSGVQSAVADTTPPGTPPVAVTRPAGKASSGETAAGVRQEVLNGTLLRHHGTREVCPRCHARIVTESTTSHTALSSAAPAGYGPADLQTAYGLPATSTSTRTIAIIDAGVYPTLEKDLAVYRRTFGLPACTTASGCLTLEDYTGGRQPAPQTGAQGRLVEEEVAVETALDVDMASAACPSCRLMEISLPWQDAQDDNDVSTADFARAVNTAVTAGASAVSISYGYTADVQNTHGTRLSAFHHPGVAVTASTGDEGFNGGIHQSWPSDLPSVISVGGITLPDDGAPTAWWAAGSGCETAFPAATGQPASVAAACDGHRAAADVSADADPASGVAIRDTYAPSSGEPGDWLVAGGTSASAPYVAGLFARAGHLSSVDGPRSLYRAPASAFTDIASGDNEDYHQCASYPGVSPKLCTAGTGWDGPTGRGVPHGLAAF
ncbi:S8 family serine peptidase [Actinacidiphila acidipaludis]|uniref:S8 family serine peptidase n=1 Tax=Actinacidiphila acidipaludis TaxID=2873382 RepID=A0ABS7QHC0_9ACTN|nr:S8 family serine peptidase [Streptomyces acidipaludis]MBY8882553.1 S8 family serine peptidase [Streptomyces acidipaludis]